MTIEEIRAAKIEAQQAITSTLKALHEKTGLAPIGVEVKLLESAHFGEPTSDREVCGVSIALEPI